MPSPLPSPWSISYTPPVGTVAVINEQDGSMRLGRDTSVTNTNCTVFGSGSYCAGEDSTMVGSLCVAGAGVGNSYIGYNIRNQAAAGRGNVVVGSDVLLSGSYLIAFGRSSTLMGNHLCEIGGGDTYINEFRVTADSGEEIFKVFDHHSVLSGSIDADGEVGMFIFVHHAGAPRLKQVKAAAAVDGKRTLYIDED